MNYLIIRGPQIISIPVAIALMLIRNPKWYFISLLSIGLTSIEPSYAHSPQQSMIVDITSLPKACTDTLRRPEKISIPIPGPYPLPKVSYSTVNNNKVMLIVCLDGEQNDEFSDLLAEYYREKSYQVVIDTTSDSHVTNLIAGNLSLYNPEEEESKQFVTYTLKLILRIYKKANSAPCSERVYTTKLRLAPGDSKDRLIKQGYLELLDKIKAAPSIPICS